MQLSDEQKAAIRQQIAQYEARRDQLLAEANMAQGAALALREMLQGGEPDGKQRVE